ncbi:hypothetical protein shim_32280 [Shimia sp. SK013]|uniref:hypothetical protein n=1 Tax=Shimia sp. SK013 TaxID=1389006 RepID=UPI0006B458AE|nr:hypothetical protein [Shimia sp. SK013]KPA20625.1 hypothetical protein shim_32280 [Shimia sp. SK013]
MTFIPRSIAIFLCLIQMPGGLSAQTSFDAAENRSFASENAILDTSIPFAIGAREAQQALRGSFGWPNFQEGLVEGVYFRFDPDGYARFAPTPRLDVDVFEVICRPRTYSCAARKEGFEMFLTDRGQIQLKLENVASGDTFHVVEGVSEIQVPVRILQPLDFQLEMLLASGGDFSARRGGTEVLQVSLKGFAAVSAYLRWISARQNYAVLPRGWPVPNGATTDAGSTVTQSSTWASPMPQPQALAPAGSQQQLPQITSPSGVPTQTEAGALRAELEELKRLMMQGNLPASAPQALPPVVVHTTTPAVPQERDLGGQELLATISALQSDLDALKTRSQHVPLAAETAIESVGHSADIAPSLPMNDTAQKMQFLMDSLGLDMQTAVAVIQMSPQAGAASNSLNAAASGSMLEVQKTPGAVLESAQNMAVLHASNPPAQVLYQTDVVDQILAEIEEEIVRPRQAAKGSDLATGRPTIEDYQLLSRYFVSVALPALSAMAQKP